jgi:hypothetical protein
MMYSRERSTQVCCAVVLGVSTSIVYSTVGFGAAGACALVLGSLLSATVISLLGSHSHSRFFLVAIASFPPVVVLSHDIVLNSIYNQLRDAIWQSIPDVLCALGLLVVLPVAIVFAVLRSTPQPSSPPQ